MANIHPVDFADKLSADDRIRDRIGPGFTILQGELVRQGDLLDR